MAEIMGYFPPAAAEDINDDENKKQAGAKLCQALNPSHNHFRRFSALNTYLGALDIL